MQVSEGTSAVGRAADALVDVRSLQFSEEVKARKDASLLAERQWYHKHMSLDSFLPVRLS